MKKLLIPLHLPSFYLNKVMWSSLNLISNQMTCRFCTISLSRQFFFFLRQTWRFLAITVPANHMHWLHHE